MINVKDLSPPIHRIQAGARILDRDVFHRTIPVHAARIPARNTGTFVKGLRNSVLDVPRTRAVIPDEDDAAYRRVLLNYKVDDEIPAATIQFLREEGASLFTHEVRLDYDFWTADDILQSILPEHLCDGCPSGFAVMGHLAHLNLNDEYLPFKHVIGQVVLDKNPRIRTVVNKLNTIHAQFRFFDMELIAGEPDFIVHHRESDCHFTFDFREVYWNSRLGAEHDRLIQLFKPEEGIVADVMAGVGPFAVPAAKKGCAVIANDLNPACARWHRKNVEDNNVGGNLRVYCEDGREFIRSSFARTLSEPFPAFRGLPLSKRKQNRGKKREHAVAMESLDPLPDRRKVAHFVMNLPDSAIKFLDAFRGVISLNSNELIGLYEELPMVHCYCFTRFLERSDAEADIRQRVTRALGGDLEEEVNLHYVRSVAPNKDMYCISFRLPRQVAFRAE